MNSTSSGGQSRQTNPNSTIQRVLDVREGLSFVGKKLSNAIDKIQKEPTPRSTPKPPNNNNVDNKPVDTNLPELRSHLEGLCHELKLITDILPPFLRTGPDISEWIGNLEGETLKVVNKLAASSQDSPPVKDIKAIKNIEDIKDVKDIIKDIKATLLVMGESLAKLKTRIQSRSHPVGQAADKPPSAGGQIEKTLVKDFSIFGGFQKDYEELKPRNKLCLLCFTFFPENVVIKKRLLIYWWAGEGLIEYTQDKTTEDVADEVLKVLVEKGFVVIVDKMCGLEPDSYKVHPLVRSALIAHAREVKFFDFDDLGNPTAELRSLACKACLVDDGRIPQDRKPEFLQTFLVEGEEEPAPEQEELIEKKLRHLQALFNLDRRFLDFKSRLFSRMKNLNVLHLGRWQNASKHHIEVENTDFLEGLKYMRYLRFVSLQGVSQILDLPEPICKLPFLRVLDLRACHNLQALPDHIGLLLKLTHLDISECYLLDGLPQTLSSLTELQVLKGFVIGDQQNGKFCTLGDLKNFKKLRKLTIHTSNDDFPRQGELDAFENFAELQKLSIAWGRGTLSARQPQATKAPSKNTNLDGSKGGQAKKQGDGKVETSTETEKIVKFPENLVKLDLQCFPLAKRPPWLIPKNLKNLKKLYIRGGEMKTLGELKDQKREEVKDQKWENVEILLLKFLSGFMLKWERLQETFPNLIYLEKKNCPRLTFYPCDESGVWKKDLNMD